jgi:hypothetical protein
MLRPLAVCAICLSASVWLPPANAAQFSFTTVDKAGASWTELDGISRRILGLRSYSTFIGNYQDINGVHGFSLTGGVFTNLPVPDGGRDLQALGINIHGQIVGTYTIPYEQTVKQEAFLFQSGVETPIYYCGINVPTVGSLVVSGLNSSGVMVGLYSQYEGVNANAPIAFQQSGDGGCITYAPGSAGTPPSVNESNETAASYTDSGGASHGYIWTYENGVGTVVDVPNATGTWLRGINNVGQTVGYYAEGAAVHGLMRDTNGTITTIDFPGATRTEVHAIADPNYISPAGQIEVLGSYTDKNHVQHGFTALSEPVTKFRPTTYK